MAVAFVYGSIARQDETATSDIDLMIVGSVSLHEVFAVLGTIEAWVGRAVNPSVIQFVNIEAWLKAEHAELLRA